MVGPGSRFSGTTHLQVNKPYLPGTLPQRQGWDPQPPGQVPPAEEVNIYVLPQRAQVGPVQKLNRSHRETQPRSISTRRAGKRFSEREVTGVDFGVFFPPSYQKDPLRSHHDCTSIRLTLKTALQGVGERDFEKYLALAAPCLLQPPKEQQVFLPRAITRQMERDQRHKGGC